MRELAESRGTPVEMQNLDELQRQMEKLFEHLATSKRPMAVFSTGNWHPNVDICETEESIFVLVELAGVDHDSIRLVADGDLLLIEGERTLGHRACKHVYHQIEISFGPFQRVLRLPVPIDPDAATASYNNGFLEISLPRARESGTHRVVIKTS
jgi:HSP20 family protein